MAICEDCPMDATIASAEKLVDQAEVNDKNRAMGGLAVTNQCLNEAAANNVCPGRFQNPTSGQIDCPLRELTFGIRAYAYAPWNQQTYTIDLASQAPANETTEAHNPGQYL
jgi:hypothetical protein